MTMTASRPPERSTRADRLAQPTTRDAVRAVAENHGACLRPIQLRRTNTDTGEITGQAAAGSTVPGRLAPGHRTHR